MPVFPRLGLQEVSMFLAKRHIKIQVPVGPSCPSATQTVVWKQLLLTAAYGCTDYQSQEQTIDKLLLDLKSPPVVN